MMGNMPGFLADPECFGVKARKPHAAQQTPGILVALGLSDTVRERARPGRLPCSTPPRSPRSVPPPQVAWQRDCSREWMPATWLCLGQGNRHRVILRPCWPCGRCAVCASGRATALRPRLLPRPSLLDMASPIETAATVQEAVAGADIICTLTKAREPITSWGMVGRRCALERRRFERCDDCGNRHSRQS